MIRSVTTRARRAFRTVADAVRSTVAPASLVRSRADETAPDPTGLLAPEEIEARAEEIEDAAADYAAATDRARSGDRGKRKARKLLDRLPAGRYGVWTVERVPSSRQTPDLEAIRATYKRLGLGDVPMRTCAPSLRVTRAAADVVPFPAADEAATAQLAA
ncbi:hypothetical protein PV411_38755 [Streptomyces sp. NRRL_B-16638]|jgi:hypothetical protein|uniref:Uncharacterized protein n=2 Tax=Streptomyces coelicolor TaxID=1902 RepID=Q8VLB8_STRCO|nr:MULTISPECIES: hypothetical protein [Streptomyces]MDX2930435.1 hypothetical protein [Streptomyces sp. NRRL_B-16638]CAC93953.1 hypothetical protein [Streptomyces coelicolor]CAD12023.1 hypothetical protein [Streptomyces coelicolor A3(2)]